MWEVGAYFSFSNYFFYDNPSFKYHRCTSEVDFDSDVNKMTPLPPTSCVISRFSTKSIVF